VNLLDQVRVEGHRGRRKDAQRVPVALGMPAGLGRRNEICAGLVFHDPRLTETRGGISRDPARDDVGQSSGRDRHDDMDRFVGIRLSQRRSAYRSKSQNGKSSSSWKAHVTRSF